MSFATGVGSHPGDTQRDLDEAVRMVLDLLPDLPYLPEVPGRGVGAAMTGRTLGLQTGLDVDLQPAGWRLTGTSGAPGRDQRRARSLLNQDLDALEERAQDRTGAFKVQVTGPWTLATTTERPRGDKVLADHGARRDLAQSLAEAVGEHVAEVRRRVPGCDRVVVQVDEPALAAVLDARVPTASGWGRHRAVDRPEASEVLGWVLGAARDAGAEPWVHSCAPGTPWALVHGAGAEGLVVDLDVLVADDLEALALAHEAGAALVLGVVDPTGPVVGEKDLAARTARWLDVVGLAPAERLGVAPGCGLAGAAAADVPRVLRALVDAARRIDDA
ncbi:MULTISPECIES: methionine synthase [unclassified Nocardioides]|uniref:methionine synthase n=1 Tax=unclassified Nocardioides TaxID=2615069 RepID=UPI0024057B34|nr:MULTISPECIES: methionine synthase [unclassified Nocardioides]